MYSSKDLEYKYYTLGDIKVIELLILYRYKYDDYMFMEGSAWDKAEIAGLNEEVLVTYLSLDRLIEDCRFSRADREMIKMVGEGYTHQEIELELGIPLLSVRGRLNTAYKKIKDENLRKWRVVTYKNTLKLKTKTCSKCKRSLPGTPEFYTADSRNRDGFHSTCNKCRK